MQTQQVQASRFKWVQYVQPSPGLEPQASVLLLDHDRDLLAELGGFLERQGFEVQAARDVEEARAWPGCWCGPGAGCPT